MLRRKGMPRRRRRGPDAFTAVAAAAIEPLEVRRLLADTYAVTGFVFRDDNGNGVYESVQEEVKLTNRIVWADLNRDGVRDAGEPSATTTGTAASYTLNL